jgi:hypothetical protein
VYDATPKTVQLSVNYNKSKGQKYKNLDVFQIDNVILLSCNIQSSSSNSPIDLRSFIELSSEIEYDYLNKPGFFSGYDILYPDQDPSIYNGLNQESVFFTPRVSFEFDINNENIVVQGGVRTLANTPTINNSNRLRDYWTDEKENFSGWIDSIEIQWTFSESKYFEYKSNLSKFVASELTTSFNPDFDNYTISVVVPYSSTASYNYKIRNVFEEGIVAIRARFIGRIAIKNVSGNIVGVKMAYCPWSDAFNTAEIFNNNAVASQGYSLGVKINTYSPTLNWIYNCTYAEDGKKKEVINYFDGTLKSRQLITTSNTDNFALIKETIYDYQGRPAIEVLPVPSPQNTARC